MRIKYNLFIVKDKYIEYNDSYYYRHDFLINELEENDYIGFKIRYYDDIEKKYKKGYKMIKIIKKEKENLWGVIGHFDSINKEENKDDQYDILYNQMLNKSKGK